MVPWKLILRATALQHLFLEPRSHFYYSLCQDPLINLLNSNLASNYLKTLTKSSDFLFYTFWALFYASILGFALITTLDLIFISTFAIFCLLSPAPILSWLDMKAFKIVKTLTQAIYIKTKAPAKDLDHSICYNYDKQGHISKFVPSFQKIYWFWWL